jgi:hypothetical protein
MASRKEQKERLRAERVAKEEAERRDTARRRRLQIGAALGAAAIVAVVVVVIVVAGGGGDGGGESKGSALTSHPDSVPADSQLALQDSPPPWKPDYKQLPQRVEAMGLPGFNETTFHLHAWLHIYDDGKQVPVPANIGVDEATGFLSPLHTHTVAPDNPEGIIHMEADQEYDFTLGQFMNVWGVKFSDNQIGSLKSNGSQKLQVYLNGELVDDPVNVVMPEHGNVVIGYGKPGSFPKEPKLDWPQGL